MKLTSLIVTLFFMVSCANLDKKIDEFSSKVASAISGAVSKPFSSSKENMDKILELANKKGFKKFITLKYSKKSRLPLKAGQSVTYLHEELGSVQHKEIIKFIVKKVKMNEVTLEVHEWESRENLISGHTGYRVGAFPTRPKFIYTQEELSQIGYALIPHEFRTFENGQLIKETYTQKEKKDVNSLNRMATRALIGHFFNRFKSTDARPVSCKTKYVKSGRCYGYKGFYKNIIGEKQEETVLMHSSIPITGVVEAKGKEHKFTLISFSRNDQQFKLFK